MTYIPPTWQMAAWLVAGMIFGAALHAWVTSRTRRVRVYTSSTETALSMLLGITVWGALALVLWIKLAH